MKTLFLFAVLFVVVAFAATPITINSITVASNNATVTTASPHALTVNQGVCLSAPSNMCGVVTTVNSSTQFTVLLASAIAACPSTCGTSSPAPQAIALGTPVQDQGHTIFTYALWLTSTQACPTTTGTSQWKASTILNSAGASGSQLAALQAGLFIEKVKSQSFPANFPIANIQAYIQNDYTEEQAALTTNTQPCQYYGFVYDSTGWIKQ